MVELIGMAIVAFLLQWPLNTILSNLLSSVLAQLGIAAVISWFMTAIVWAFWHADWHAQTVLPSYPSGFAFMAVPVLVSLAVHTFRSGGFKFRTRA